MTVRDNLIVCRETANFEFANDVKPRCGRSRLAAARRWRDD
jgi:hypothetical protein